MRLFIFFYALFITTCARALTHEIRSSNVFQTANAYLRDSSAAAARALTPYTFMYVHYNVHIITHTRICRVQYGSGQQVRRQWVWLGARRLRDVSRAFYYNTRVYIIFYYYYRLNNENNNSCGRRDERDRRQNIFRLKKSPCSRTPHTHCTHMYEYIGFVTRPRLVVGIILKSVCGTAASATREYFYSRLRRINNNNTRGE